MKHFQLRMACIGCGQVRTQFIGYFGGLLDIFHLSNQDLIYPYEQKTKFVPPTRPAQLTGSHEEALNGTREKLCTYHNNKKEKYK